MNIFILDRDVKNCAQYHCDKHIVKMPLELAQMVSYIHHDEKMYPTKPIEVMGYSKTHLKHPCSIWLKESLSNLIFGCELGIELVKEYRYRYDSEKHQRSLDIFEGTLANLPKMIDYGMTEFALAMPYQYHTDDAIQSYREYYRKEKIDFLKYTKRDFPYWLSDSINID